MRFAAGLTLALVLTLPAAAEPRVAPVLLELYTSQGCYSCPPADELLARLRLREDVVALEFHVDYWNNLVYGSSGNWVDVHSRPEFTARQQAYARAARLKGRRGVYTPQMVIGGQYAAVGSDAREIASRIAQLQKSPPALVVSADVRGQRLEIAVSGTAPPGAALWLARYDLHHATAVTGGENDGKEMHNYHVVTSLEKIADQAPPADMPLVVDGVSLGRNQGCAVFFQDARLGRILGAARCTPEPV